MISSSCDFNIRVYALIQNYKREILISQEFQLDTPMIKFPGGGLIYGEGILDCIKREIKEECNQEIKNVRHFYTTDFFQEAKFFKNTQLISIYFIAELENPELITESFNNNFLENHVNGFQLLSWLSIDSLNPEMFTFPIDKYVAKKFIQLNN